MLAPNGQSSAERLKGPWSASTGTHFCMRGLQLSDRARPVRCRGPASAAIARRSRPARTYARPGIIATQNMPGRRRESLLTSDESAPPCRSRSVADRRPREQGQSRRPTMKEVRDVSPTPIENERCRNGGAYVPCLPPGPQHEDADS